MPFSFPAIRKGLLHPGFLLLVFCAAFAAFTLFVIFRPVGEVEGQSKPTVKIVSVSPSPVREGGRIEVVVSISPLVTDDYYEAECYNRREMKPCVEGGIRVFDTYNDSPDNMSVDELIAFVFRKTQVTRTMSHAVAVDCVPTSGRTIRIEINNVFDGYTVGSPSERTITVLNDREKDLVVRNHCNDG